ncbi:MAG: hypothetical protein HRU20_08685 [Pseudomonadales bacterium]|nr:hypothetical protein [Pseudomonadales bacterium]
MLLCFTSFSHASVSNAKSSRENNELVLISHPSNNIQPLKFKTLRAIYSMRLQTWPDGSAINVFVLPDNSLNHIGFCKQLLKTLPRHLRKNWDRLIFSGISMAPSMVEDANNMKQSIASTPGAIGYIPRGEIDESVVIINITN